MTALYRQERPNIVYEPTGATGLIPLSETFAREAFDAVLGESDCVGLRIYYGMKDDLSIHAIVVGVNSDNEDILPSATASVSSLVGGNPTIIEDGNVCPPICPPPSPLNP